MSRLMIFFLSLIVFIVPLVYVPGWFPVVLEDRYLIKLYVAEILVVCACLALVCSFLRPGVLRIRWTITAPVIFFLLCCFLSVFVSVDRWMSAEICFRHFSYCMLFLIASRYVSNDADLQKIISWLLGSVLCVALCGLWQYLQGHEVYATIGNRNFLGSVLILVLPLAVARAMSAVSKRLGVAAAGWILVAVLFTFVLFLTKSRGAVTALVLAVFAFFEIVLLVKGKRLVALIGVCYASIVCASIAANPAFVKEMSGDVRLYLWQGALQMIAAHPLTGWGLGTFFIYFPTYRPADYFLLKKAADVTYHPHNEILSRWAEAGIFGVIAFVCVMAVFIVLFYVECKKQNKINPLRGALFVGVLAVFGQSFVDMNLAIPSVAVLFWLSMGIVTSGSDALAYGAYDYFQNKRLSRGCVSLFTAGILLFAGWLYIVRPLLAQVYFGKGSAARMQDTWEEAIRYYRKGLIYAPQPCEILYKLAYAYDHLGLTQNAIDTYLELKGIAPHFGRVDFNLAVLYDKAGNLPAARGSLTSWLTLDPYDTNAQRYLSDIYLRLGNTSAAQE